MGTMILLETVPAGVTRGGGCSCENLESREREKMTIAEVSVKCNISSDTLRYYEKEGLIPPVPRTKGGIRDYKENDIKWVLFAKYMRDAGVSVESLREYVLLFEEGDSSFPERKAILIREREKLVKRISQMQDSLERLNYKIENYDTVMKSFEKSLE